MGESRTLARRGGPGARGLGSSLPSGDWGVEMGAPRSCGSTVGPVQGSAALPSTRKRVPTFTDPPRTGLPDTDPGDRVACRHMQAQVQGDTHQHTEAACLPDLPTQEAAKSGEVCSGPHCHPPTDAPRV